MREIKCRAWYMPFGPKGLMQEMVYSKASSILAFAEMSPDEYIVEQCTDIKDINGKPIHEGDILKVTADANDSYMAPVKWFGDEGYPAFDLDRHYIPNRWDYEANVLSTIADMGDHAVVVGNIHENSDLLEEIK